MYSDLKNVILYRLNTKQTVNRCKKIFKIDLNIPFSVNKNNHQLAVSLNVSLKYFTLLKSTVTQYVFFILEKKVEFTLHFVVRYGCIVMACLTISCALILVNR